MEDIKKNEGMETAAEEIGKEASGKKENKSAENGKVDRKKFSFKKKFCVVLAVLIVLGAACLSAMFFLKTDYSEAREKAIEYAGPDSQIVSEESEAEFLFFNEYSFGVISGNEYYEIDINAFGIITSVERSKLSV